MGLLPLILAGLAGTGQAAVEASCETMFNRSVRLELIETLGPPTDCHWTPDQSGEEGRGSGKLAWDGVSMNQTVTGQADEWAVEQDEPDIPLTFAWLTQHRDMLYETIDYDWTADQDDSPSGYTFWPPSPDRSGAVWQTDKRGRLMHFSHRLLLD